MKYKLLVDSNYLTFKKGTAYAQKLELSGIGISRNNNQSLQYIKRSKIRIEISNFWEHFVCLLLSIIELYGVPVWNESFFMKMKY